jgi:hypothetical protein
VLHTCGPLAHTTPICPFGTVSLVSGCTSLIVVPGGGSPTEPFRLCSATLLHITGDVSVKP